ncbi:ABC transporter permease [Chloroflexi bacterium TSY]|nr:ABC transporter permease [Chloroflexi bacterium TSY]
MDSSISLTRTVQTNNIPVRARRLSWQILQQLLRNRAAVVGLLFLGMVILCAIFAPQVAPYDPIEINASNTLQPPSRDHWFGTDNTGCDVFSRVIWGARISLRVSLISSGISTMAGTVLGIISGFYGGLLSFLILRLMDLLLAFPGVLLAVVIVATLGPSLDNVMIAVGISAIPRFTRVVHSSTLSVKESDYTLSAVAIGGRNLQVMLRHILPNIMAPVIVLGTLQVGAAIFGAASLSFIGLGAQPPTPEWGAMVSRGRHTLRDAIWLSTFPGLAIALVVIAINIVGDALRDALGPRIRER